MDVDNFGSWVTVAENGTANLTAAASSQVKIQNTSIQMDPWEGAHSTEMARLDNRYFTKELAYRDFVTAVQILVLIGSLLGKQWPDNYNTNVLNSSFRSQVHEFRPSGPLCSGALYFQCVNSALVRVNA